MLYALSTLFAPRRQFWHDLLCGTRLVDARAATTSGDAQTASSFVSPVRMRTTLLDLRDENLAVADLAGSRRLDDGVDAASVDHLSATTTSIFTFGRKSTDVFRAAIELGVAFLAAEPLTSVTVRPGDADLGQRFAHFIELEGLDDGLICFMAMLRGANAADV